MTTITAREAATEYGVSLSTIYRRIRAGILTAVKIARRWAITKEKKMPSQYWIEHKPARGSAFMVVAEQWIVWTRDHKKISSHSSETAAEAAIARLEAPEATLAEAPITGWSNAAKRRAADVHNALGRGISSGKGYTMYEGADGSGRYNTQIWDES